VASCAYGSNTCVGITVVFVRLQASLSGRVEDYGFTMADCLTADFSNHLKRTTACRNSLTVIQHSRLAPLALASSRACPLRRISLPRQGRRELAIASE